MSHKSFLAPLPIRLASETTLKIQTLQSCTCFRATLRFKHLPRSHLTPIQPHPLFLQPTNDLRVDPLPSLYLLFYSDPFLCHWHFCRFEEINNIHERRI